jgi:hypothetical protein
MFRARRSSPHASESARLRYAPIFLVPLLAMAAAHCATGSVEDDGFSSPRKTRDASDPGDEAPDDEDEDPNGPNDPNDPNDPTPRDGGRTDAGADAGPTDAGRTDATTDAAVDAPVDAPADAPPEAGPLVCAIGSLTPAELEVGDTRTVRIAGERFHASATVTVDGKSAPVTANTRTAQRLDITVPADVRAAAGSYDVIVQNPAATCTAKLSVVNPAPTVTSLSPSAVRSGTTGVTVTIEGTKFIAGSRVLFTPRGGGATTTLTPTSFTATRLVVGVPDALTANDAVYDVVVESPTPGGGRSAPPRSFTTFSGNCAIEPASQASLQAAGDVADINLSWSGAPRARTIYVPGSTACPWSGAPVTNKAYRAVVVQNVSPAPMRIAAWTTCNTSSDAAFLAMYAGATVPQTQAQQQQCLSFVATGWPHGAPDADRANSSTCPGLLASRNAAPLVQGCGSVVVWVEEAAGPTPTRLRVRAEAP